VSLRPPQVQRHHHTQTNDQAQPKPTANTFVVLDRRGSNTSTLDSCTIAMTGPSTSTLEPAFLASQVVAHSQQQHGDINHVNTAQLTQQPEPNLDNYVLEIQPYVVTIDQMPSPVTSIINKTGRTNTSAILTCRLRNGYICTVPQRQLSTIIGEAALQTLLSEYQLSLTQ
jgi:hypothetical protein